MIIRNEDSWKDSGRKNTPREARVTSPAWRFDTEPRSGQSIRFRLADVYAPSLPDLFKHITPALELEGSVRLLSDGGATQDAYAMVEVPGILLPMIVPTSCLEAVLDDSND